MATKFPWLKLAEKTGKKTDPELPCEPPIWLGNRSNGEYYREQTPREARMREEIFRRADAEAPRHGMDRRSFLASSFGIATTLTVINELGCKSSESGSAPVAGPGCSPDAGFPLGAQPYVVPPPTTCDPSQYLAGNEFIFDVQTHCFDSGEWRTKNIVYPTFLNLLGQGKSWCASEANPVDCFDPNYYAELMFVDSDTTMTVITSWPAASCFPERDLLSNSALACGLPLSNAGMRNLRDWINAKSLSQRCINQVQVMPNDFIEHQIEGMYAAMADSSWRCGSWKAYPAWTSDTFQSDAGRAQGYFMTDPIGRKFVEAGLKLGVPNFAIHKGLPIPGFDVVHNEPTDIGPIARDYPDANFVIYHSAINAGTGGTPIASLFPMATEGVPYSAKDPKPLGVNMLIRSLIDHGMVRDPDHPDTSMPLPARLNVFAEMGSAWSQVMTDTNASQHYIGKLLKYLGPDNIVWGTDCILGGSPQQQIVAFRAFHITPEYQAKYGYPAITDDIKKKIFGLNAARIYHVDPTTARCAVKNSSFSMMKRHLDEGVGPNRWTVKPPLGPRTYEEFLANARAQRTKRAPG